MNDCEYAHVCRVRRTHRDLCGDTLGKGISNIEECDVRKEYLRSGITADEIYDTRCRAMNERLSRQHLVPNTSGEAPWGRGWRL